MHPKEQLLCDLSRQVGTSCDRFYVPYVVKKKKLFGKKKHQFMTSQHVQLIASTLNLKTKGIENTMALFQDGATIPFIARYRKEATGSLDEVEIAAIHREKR